MAEREVVSHLSSGLFKFCRDRKIALPNAKDVRVGDIVVCSPNKNWEDPDDMGRVLHVAPAGRPVKLPKGHPDGAKGHIFVQTFSKQLKPRGKLSGFVNL